MHNTVVLAAEGPDELVSRFCLASWACNDCAIWKKQKGGKYRALEVTDEMRTAARDLNRKLSCYAAGMVVGPAAATTWNLDCSWDTGAAELLKLVKPAHFHHWKSSTFWAGIEKAPDGWHAAANPDTARLIAGHLARAAD